MSRQLKTLHRPDAEAASLPPPPTDLVTIAERPPTQPLETAPKATGGISPSAGPFRRLVPATRIQQRLRNLSGEGLPESPPLQSASPCRQRSSRRPTEPQGGVDDVPQRED